MGDNYGDTTGTFAEDALLAENARLRAANEDMADEIQQAHGRLDRLGVGRGGDGGNSLNLRLGIVESVLARLRAQVDAVKAIIGFELYYENDGWRPACKSCGYDVVECDCSAADARRILGIVPPLDAEGNVLDEAEWERLLKETDNG